MVGTAPGLGDLVSPLPLNSVMHGRRSPFSAKQLRPREGGPALMEGGGGEDGRLGLGLHRVWQPGTAYVTCHKE